MNLTILAEMCRANLREIGLQIEVIDNLSVYEGRLSEIGKRENHRVISTKLHDLVSCDAFGLIIRSEGRDVGGVAARLLRLGATSLAEYWRSSSKRLYGDSVTDVVGRVVRPAEQMRGNIVYEGELYLDAGFRGGNVNLTAVMFYLHVLSVLQWSPDWIYGFIRQEHISKVGKYGFTGVHVGAQQWLHEVERRGSDECLVTLQPENLHDAAAHYVAAPGLFNQMQRSHGKRVVQNKLTSVGGSDG